MADKISSVVIPHDGSELSGRIAKAAGSVLGSGCKITMVHVATSEADDDSEIEATASRLESEGLAVAQHSEAAPDAASALLDYIGSNRPDLVMMTTHGRSGTGQFTRGSVAERVMRECPSPLMMVDPTEEANMPPRRVLVPLDASDNAAEVIPPLLGLIDSGDTKVTLLFVDFDDPTDTDELRSKRREQRQADVAEWFRGPFDQLTTAGADVEVRVEHGNAAEVILRVANEPQYDLLAMTTHGRSGIARWAFGSVADKVLSACSKPVLLKRIK